MQTCLFDLLGGTFKDLPSAWDSILTKLPPYPRLFFRFHCQLKEKKNHKIWIEVKEKDLLPKAFEYLGDIRKAVNDEFLINSYINFVLPPSVPEIKPQESPPKIEGISLDGVIDVSLDHPKGRFLVELKSASLLKIAESMGEKITAILQKKFNLYYYTTFYSFDLLNELANNYPDTN